VSMAVSDVNTLLGRDGGSEGSRRADR
jgi:hypothetical protein